MMHQKLLEDNKLLIKQLSWIEISFKECTRIGIKKDYTVDEFGRFET